MNVIPCQADNLANPQGAGKRKVDCDIQSSVFALVECFANGSSIPYFTRFALDFRKRCVFKGVLCDNVPAHSLTESTAQQFVDAFDIGRCHILRFAVSVLISGAFRPLQRGDKTVCGDRSYILHQRTAKFGIDVVANQSRIGFIGAGAPFLCSV